jgi:tetratricopeptide (TPR) repeat protein
VEHQIGDRILGKAYCERDNSERVDKWNVEIVLLIPLYYRLTSSFMNEESLSLIDTDNLSFPILEKVLDLLNPWSADLNFHSTSQIDNLDKDQVDHIVNLLSGVERKIGLIHINRSQFNQAEIHCQQALFYARLYEGKEERKTDLLCEALGVYVNLRGTQGKFADAVIYAEEAYNLVAVAYNPVHPKVQKAAGRLIESLIHKGDLFNAERFAQATLDSLKDPGNGLGQESEEVADGYYLLAKVINQQEGDFVRAEMLVRESLRINSQLFCHDNESIGASVDLLASILRSQGKLGHETKELHERSLATETKHHGADGLKTAVANTNIGVFYYKLTQQERSSKTIIEHLRLSLSHHKEAMRIYTKIFGPDNPRTMKALSNVSILSSILSAVPHKYR